MHYLNYQELKLSTHWLIILIIGAVLFTGIRIIKKTTSLLDVKRRLD
jgi:hypothetical protein